MPRAENVDFQVVIDVTKNAYSFCKNSHLNSEINLAIATPTGATHPSRAQSWCQARQSCRPPPSTVSVSHGFPAGRHPQLNHPSSTPSTRVRGTRVRLRPISR
jgi:hypothetical protein